MAGLSLFMRDNETVATLVITLMLRILGKIFNKESFEIFFPGNGIYIFMQIVSIGDNLQEMSNPVSNGDNLHEMSNPVSWEKEEKYHQFFVC